MIELLRNRRSIRKYTDKDIEPEKIEILKEAVLRSPSSRNFDPWEFIFVDDRGLLKQLALCKPHGAKFLEGAALGIVICADEQKSDVWIEDCSIASIFVQMISLPSLGFILYSRSRWQKSRRHIIQYQYPVLVFAGCRRCKCMCSFYGQGNEG